LCVTKQNGAELSLDNGGFSTGIVRRAVNAFWLVAERLSVLSQVFRAWEWPFRGQPGSIATAVDLAVLDI
jgi:hypothetical protein